MTVPCKFGCGKQILYHSEKFSDGFIYRVPMQYESDVPIESLKVHKCPIFEKELDIFTSSDWEWITDVTEKNRFDDILADMLEHLGDFYFEWEEKHKTYGLTSVDVKKLTSLDKDILLKWKSVIQSDMNHISYPDIEFILSEPSCEFKEAYHLLILGKIYQKLEMYLDASQCYTRYSSILVDDNTLSTSSKISQVKNLNSIMNACNKQWLLSGRIDLSQLPDDIKSQSYELMEGEESLVEREEPLVEREEPLVEREEQFKEQKEEYDQHTQKHISHVEENMREFIMRLYDNNVSNIRENFPQIWESIEIQRKKDEKLLYEPLKEHELDKITFGQLIKILENRKTHVKIKEHGIFNSDDLLRHLVLISEYRNPLDHSKGLVDGDLAKNYKYFVISNCLIVNKWFEKFSNN